MTGFSLDTIVQGDCLEQFCQIPNDTFHMSFADPPFNLDKKYDTYDDQLDEGEYIDWSLEWLEQVVRVTRPGGSIFIHNIPKWLARYCCILDTNFGLQFRHWIAWDAPSQPMGRSLQPAHYGILYYVKPPVEDSKVYELRMPHKRCRERECRVLQKDYGGKKHQIHPFGPLVSDVWTDIHRCKHSRYKDEHPCQLPLHMLERLILLCTDENDAVFDPFLGTGTTALAAKRLGRKYFGVELASKYYDCCLAKLDKQKLFSRLDQVWVSCYLRRVHTVRDCDLWDASAKAFRPEWVSLFETWPDTDDKRRQLNTQDLHYRQDIRQLISDLCVPLFPKETKNEHAKTAKFDQVT